MSLTLIQQQNTRKEFKQNFENSGLTTEKIAHDLRTTPEHIAGLMERKAIRLEDPWILRNYLIEYLRKNDREIVEFTALEGDWHRHWFLDGSYIDGGVIH